MASSACKIVFLNALLVLTICACHKKGSTEQFSYRLFDSAVKDYRYPLLGSGMPEDTFSRFIIDSRLTITYDPSQDVVFLNRDILKRDYPYDKNAYWKTGSVEGSGAFSNYTLVGFSADSIHIVRSGPTIYMLNKTQDIRGYAIP